MRYILCMLTSVKMVFRTHTFFFFTLIQSLFVGYFNSSLKHVHLYCFIPKVSLQYMQDSRNRVKHYFHFFLKIHTSALYNDPFVIVQQFSSMLTKYKGNVYREMTRDTRVYINYFLFSDDYLFIH